MNLEIAERKLGKQYLAGTLGRVYGPEIAAAFNALVAVILAVANESELYAFKGLRPEKLQGRGDERSMRLNGQMRLIYTLEVTTVRVGKTVRQETTLCIQGIEDYH